MREERRQGWGDLRHGMSWRLTRQSGGGEEDKRPRKTKWGKTRGNGERLRLKKREREVEKKEDR